MYRLYFLIIFFKLIAFLSMKERKKKQKIALYKLGVQSIFPICLDVNLISFGKLIYLCYHNID